MLKGKTNIRKFLIIPLMIGLVGWITFNKIVFLHTHQYDNGSIVVHAHPYEKDTGDESGASHKHTLFELFSIENLSLLFISAFTQIAIDRVFCIQNNVKTEQSLVQLLSKVIFKDRAPPVVHFS